MPAANDDGDVLLLHRQGSVDRAAGLETLGLTDREAEILGLVAQGHTNADIATELFVEPSTVKTHLEHVYRKLGVRDRLMAVQRARDAGLLAPPTGLVPRAGERRPRPRIPSPRPADHTHEAPAPGEKCVQTAVPGRP